MRVKLLAPHIFNGQQFSADTVLNVDAVTPLMIGLEPAATAAIQAEVVRVYGRWTLKAGKLVLLDDPPLVRTLDNAQPIPPLQCGGPPR